MNRLCKIDQDLKGCYEEDIDWTAVPDVSFCVGHSTVEVHSFWIEPVILWISVMLPTGEIALPFTSLRCLIQNIPTSIPVLLYRLVHSFGRIEV